MTECNGYSDEWTHQTSHSRLIESTFNMTGIRVPLNTHSLFVVLCAVLVPVSLVVIFILSVFGLGTTLGTALVCYLGWPFLFHFSKDLQRHLVFLYWVRYTPGSDYYNPKSHGIKGGRCFYLNPENDSKIGVWHLLPTSLAKLAPSKVDNEYWDARMKDGLYPIIIYFHGNSGTRGTGHRVELYKLFQQQDCHVVAFDYRGYADSTQMHPSETTTVTDGLTVLNWVRATIGKGSNVPIFIWGHSLGTGISSHMLANTFTTEDSSNLSNIKGLILENPFSSIGEVVKRNYLLNLLYYFWPARDWFFIEPLKDNDFLFESVRHIKNIPTPILILHALNDPIVPYRLGVKLYHVGLNERTKTAKPIYFRRFGQLSMDKSHVFICRHAKLPSVISDFTNSCLQDKWPCESLSNFDPSCIKS